MARSKLNRSTLVRAVGYLRRSTNKQEKSLPDQQREIERYADRQGYEIVRWYRDDAISGDDTYRRTGFLSMRDEACNGGDFEVILVWDQDRFGRFDSLEAGHWIHPLRAVGVRLETVTEGRIDWNDFTGRLMYGIKQEGKHQFLRDLSRNTARGQITNAQQGYLCGQPAPYGYDRVLIDETGQQRQRVKNGDAVVKPKGWRVRLIPSDDAEIVKTVRWIFTAYLEADTGLRAIASSLNAKGIPGPRGGTWCVGTIRDLLRNEAYVGDFVWNKRRQGKYHRVTCEGEIRERDSQERSGAGSPLAVDNMSAEWIVFQDAHEALIDRKMFQAVQDKLTRRRTCTTSGKQKNGDCYVLSGLLYCGNCGSKMYGTMHTRRKEGTTYKYPKYVCSGYHTRGRAKCGYCNIDQRPLLAFLIAKLRGVVLAGGQREELRRLILDRLNERQQTDPRQIKQLQRRLVDLDREIQHGTKRLLRASDDVADLLGAELSSMKRDRDRVAAELNALESAKPVDVESEANELVERLWTLADELQRAKPERLRELLYRMVSRIDLRFGKKQKRTRVERPFQEGVINLRPDPMFADLSVAGTGFEPATSRL